MRPNQITEEDRSALRRFRFFERVDASLLDTIWDAGSPLDLPGSSLVYEEGMPSDTFYLLLAGTVEIVFTLGDGRTIPFRTATAPDFFGVEAASMEAGERITRVTTETPVRLFAMSGASLYSSLFRFPGLQLAVTHRLIQVVRFLLQRPGSASSRTARERVTLVLLGMAMGGQALTPNGGRAPKPALGGWVRVPPITTEELARHAGTSRETVSRIVGEMESHQLLRREGPGRWLVNPDAIVASDFARDRRSGGERRSGRDRRGTGGR